MGFLVVTVETRWLTKAWLGALIVLFFNTSAYAGEIFYGALRAVPSQDLESADAFGFTGIKKFTNLPRLRYFWFHNNQITGKIPDFSDCPRLYYLVMYNNQFTTYESGSFKNITQIRYLDVGRNSLTQTSINQIVTDLYDNYLAAPRGSVVINLSGGTNAAPSGPALDLVTILESNGWDIRSN